MKHILIASGIFAPDIGGPASYARALGNRLTRQGVRVTILTYSSVHRYAGDRTLPFRVCRVWGLLPWGVRHVMFFMRCLLLARHADGILSLNAVSAGVPAVWAAQIAGIPLIVRIAGDYAWEMAVLSRRTFLLIDEFQASKKSGRIKQLDRIQRWTCRHAARVIVPSEYLARLVSGWGIAERAIVVIYNGVDAVPVPIAKDEARRRIGISGNIIVSAGRLVPWKGFRMLIKLMPQLLQVNQFFRLIIVGDGPDMRTLTTMVRNLGLERKVWLVGRKTSSELMQYLAAADMFVLNTAYEGFSHQVLEAMIAGVPVITTAVGGNGEVITSGQDGFLVRYNDEFNLIEAIKMLWRQEDVRNQLIADARRSAARFSVERMFERTTQVLNEQFR